MEFLSSNGLITAADLYYMMGENSNIKLLDATYSSPNPSLSPFQTFLTRRIDGAQFFDIDVVADQNAPLSHTAPSENYFSACASALGISNNDHVVIYDQSGAYMASSRAWWLFRLFGHNHVYVLEGGLNAWISGGFPTINGDIEPPETAKFKSNFQQNLLATRNDLMENLQTKKACVLDARPSMRFDGNAPEPRAGMRSGHIPQSYNIPFSETLEGRSAMFKSDDDLDALFHNVGVSKNDSVIVTCGSGVTACTVALAMFKSRGQNAAIYDGSWAEWGDELSGTPIEVSA